MKTADFKNHITPYDPFEAREIVPFSELGRFEEQGYCADGCAFVEENEQKIAVHRSSVFDGAKSLRFPGAGAAVCAKADFTFPADAKVTLYATALGYYEPACNGRALTDEKFIPALSDYVPRDLSHVSYPIFDTMSHRIYYHVYDLTPFLDRGRARLTFHIGTGWLDNRNRAEGMPVWDEKFLIFRLRVETPDGASCDVGSAPDNTRWVPSFITDTSLYYGEEHDYALLKEEPTERPCEEKTLPPTYFAPTFFDGDREEATITPELVRQDGNLKIYDLHLIPAGYPLIVPTAPGEVTVTYGDRLLDKPEDGTVFALRHTGGEHRAQKDVYRFTEAEVGKAFHVHFTWHACRYIAVEGQADVPAFVRVHSPLTQTVFYKSENPTLQWIFDAFVNTYKSNLHGYIPSDCPHRERLGYTGDGQLTSRAGMRVFDGRTMYKKWMRDILDCQDLSGGHVQHTAPFLGGGGGPGGWGGAVCIVPWNYYDIYGDDTLLRDSYNAMKAYIVYMLRHCENGLVTSEEKDGWCLGDWCPPHNDVKIPTDFVNTYFLIRCLAICEKTADHLGRSADAAYFAVARNDEEAAFTKAYFEPATGSFCGGIQGADAFALDIGLGDERTKRNLIGKYERLGAFDTGIFGTDLVLKVLLRLDRKDLAKRLLSNETENSFYNMKLGGDNTLWENWDGCDSLCHPMFGAVVDSLLDLEA